MKEFIEFQYALYKDDPLFRSPATNGRQGFAEPGKAPVLHECRDGDVCGAARREGGRDGSPPFSTARMTAFTEEGGFFGFFECIDDQAVADALLGRPRNG